MDYSPIIGQIWGMLAWFVPAALLISLLKLPLAKGHIGDLLVRFFAHRQLDEPTYRRLHNVTLNTPDGTTQIDHIFLSLYGIFVLETKNMCGWICGGERQAQWTQKLYKRTFKFQNPLRQNYKRLKILEATLDVSPEHLHSVITFVGGSTFKTEVPANVTHGIGFIRYIKSFQQPVFSGTEVDTVLHPLQTGRRVPTLARHREHVKDLKRRSDTAAESQYPKCGIALFIHTVMSGAKRGSSFGDVLRFPIAGQCRVFYRLSHERCMRFAFVNKSIPFFSKVKTRRVNKSDWLLLIVSPIFSSTPVSAKSKCLVNN